VEYEESVQVWVTTVARELAMYGLDLWGVKTVKTGGKTICSEIHKITIWIKEELPEGWKKSIIVPIYKKGNKTDCSNYRGITVLSPT